MGKIIMFVGFAISGLNYLLTCGFFFANGDGFLGLVLLLVPPAELVLPWVASTRLGVMSLVGIALIFLGAAISPQE